MEASAEESADAIKITILEAVNMAQLAWDKVTPDHIKCYRHGGIRRSDKQGEDEDEGDTTGLNMVDIVGVPFNLSEEDFKATMDVNEELSVMRDLSDRGLLSISQEDEEEPQPPLTSKELMTGLVVVRR